jgi:transcriptional regulator with PAS, ATPase and Fis domain
MKKKALSYYLDLMNSALDKQDWAKAKRYGEIADKQLPLLSYSPVDEYFLHIRRGFTYHRLSLYSQSLDCFYKADLLAAKNNFKPAYNAYIYHNMGYNYFVLRYINQALSQFQKVEQYYQKYGDNTPPMTKRGYLHMLTSLGYCYLYKNELAKGEEIVDKKLAPCLLSSSDDDILGNYHHLKGEYLIQKKNYNDARISFQKSIKLYEKASSNEEFLASKLHLAVIDLLERKLESGIHGLKSIMKDARRLKLNRIICEAGILLSKSYLLNKIPAKSFSIEKRLKPFLNTLDITWFYERTREYEELYQQLQTIYSSKVSVSAVFTETLNRHYELSEHKYFIIGKSLSMLEAYQHIGKIAPTDLPVLIQGETGTGKELVARSIHYNSLRKEKLWLALNCGAVPETLLESELFGYNKGAFTDAQADRKGHIELASDGTLFLDEIAEMSPAMQQKLLRVLEDKQVWKLGAEKPIPVNTRFIFASNQDVEGLVKRKLFRQDLFYRINTIVINLPPLRDRKDDIPLLVKHFLKMIDEKKEIKEEALKLLVDYNWPGNVRELGNEIKRICSLYPGIKLIAESMLSESIRSYKLPFTSNSDRTLLKEAKKVTEKDIIIEALKKCKGNVAETACQFGYNRSSFYRKIKRLKIDIADPSGGDNK